MLRAMSLVARAGDVIRDDHGAVVATVVRNIVRGQVAYSSDFEFANGRQPVGELIPVSVLRYLHGR